MNTAYGWSEDLVFFYCDGQAFANDEELRTFLAGLTEDFIDHHPLGKKDDYVPRLRRKIIRKRK